jgi:hypothetical protein
MSKTQLGNFGTKDKRNYSGEVRLDSMENTRLNAFRIKYGPDFVNKKRRPKTIIIEKERLYEENLQLKMLSNNLLEENIKLKTKLQQTENNVKRNYEKSPEKDSKSLNLIFSLKSKIKDLYEKIDKITNDYNELKLSIRATRVTELEQEAKQYFNECWRLKKILEETSKSSKSSPKHKINRNEEAPNSYLEKISEQAAAIDKLLIENKDQKTKLEANSMEIDNLKTQLESLNSGLKKKIDKSSEESFDKFPTITIQKNFDRQTTNLSSEDRELKRELIANPDLFLENFFRKIYFQLNSRSLTVKNFISQLNPEAKDNLELQEVRKYLQENNYKFASNEIKAVSEILVKKYNSNSISPVELEKLLHAHDLDSNKSYDISSESSKSNSFLEKNVVEGVPVSLEEVSDHFNYLYVVLSYHKLNRESFIDYFISKVPKEINAHGLSKFFLQSYARIEDGVERNKICSFLMDGKEVIENHQICSKLVQLIFSEDDTDDAKREKLKNLLDLINSDSKKFIEKCQEKDTREKNFLLWKDIEDVIADLGLETDAIALNELKVLCYGFEKSLNIIPF